MNITEIKTVLSLVRCNQVSASFDWLALAIAECQHRLASIEKEQDRIKTLLDMVRTYYQPAMYYANDGISSYWNVEKITYALTFIGDIGVGFTHEQYNAMLYYLDEQRLRLESEYNKTNDACKEIQGLIDARTLPQNSSVGDDNG